MDWASAVTDVIEKTIKRNVTDRLEILDFIVSLGEIDIDQMNERCGGGYRRDNRFINPVTKIIHGRERRDSTDNWLPFNEETRSYRVHADFAKAWKAARGNVANRWPAHAGSSPAQRGRGTMRSIVEGARPAEQRRRGAPSGSLRSPPAPLGRGGGTRQAAGGAGGCNAGAADDFRSRPRPAAADDFTGGHTLSGVA